MTLDAESGRGTYYYQPNRIKAFETQASKTRDKRERSNLTCQVPNPNNTTIVNNANPCTLAFVDSMGEKKSQGKKKTKEKRKQKKSQYTGNRSAVWSPYNGVKVAAKSLEQSPSSSTSDVFLPQIRSLPVSLTITYRTHH
jgi:hypothetical protein